MNLQLRCGVSLYIPSLLQGRGSTTPWSDRNGKLKSPESILSSTPTPLLLLVWANLHPLDSPGKDPANQAVQRILAHPAVFRLLPALSPHAELHRRVATPGYGMFTSLLACEHRLSLTSARCRTCLWRMAKLLLPETLLSRQRGQWRT